MNFLETPTFVALLLNIKTIVIYLILLLFMIDLAKADSYNKVARILKIILYPILLIMNIHYKKFNVGLLFSALLIEFLVQYFIYLPGGSVGLVASLAFYEIALALILVLKVVIISGVVLSWLYMFGGSFYNSFTSILQEVYESTVSVFRNIIPPTGGFDLSPLVAIFILQLSQRVLNTIYCANLGIGCHYL